MYPRPCVLVYSPCVLSYGADRTLRIRGEAEYCRGAAHRNGCDAYGRTGACVGVMPDI